MSSLAGALTVLFVALKLLEVIDWEWIWVVSPLWISALLAVAFFVGLFVVAFIATLLDDIKLGRFKRR